MSWQPLTLVEARGFIVYRVELRASDTSSVFTAPGNQSNVTITGLESSTSYEVTVAAVTADGGFSQSKCMAS